MTRTDEVQYHFTRTPGYFQEIRWCHDCFPSKSTRKLVESLCEGRIIAAILNGKYLSPYFEEIHQKGTNALLSYQFVKRGCALFLKRSEKNDCFQLKLV